MHRPTSIFKFVCVAAALFFAAAQTAAQIVDPVKFTASLKTGGTAEGEIVFSGKIDRGWHVYSTNLGGGGPVEASLSVSRIEGAELVGKLVAKGAEQQKFDKLFGMQVRFFEGSVQFVQKLRFTKPEYSIEAALEYGACDDESCLPPTQVPFKAAGKSPATAAEKPAEKPMGEAAEKPEKQESNNTAVGNSAVAAVKAETDSVAAVGDTLAAAKPGDLWQPVTAELKAMQEGGDSSSRPWIYIFALGFIGGLLALFTPCVWPIIPMTVSFFLKRAGNRRKALRDAAAYGLSIVAIYLALGLAVTAIMGPSALNAMATNAVFNIFFCLLLVVFALSFFGWFELSLPSKWTNAADTKATAASGYASIFLMAFTLALVSFSCTGPIIGFLLVDFATSGNFWGPALGMLGFAIALALPFTLFALFPSWLKQAPKSGAWMNIIKVSLGFVELAFALKFFSVADLAYGWGLLDREVFLSIWIAIFLLLGLYLTGVFHFQSDAEGGEVKPKPVAAVMLGLASLAFAAYMLPGLWGAPCKAVSAFAPPMSTQDFNLYTHEVKAQFDDYDKGMAYAAEQGKPALVDFTGFGCVNCRKMEAAVWTDPGISKRIEEQYVLISLFVDDKTPLATPMEVEENGTKRTLRTVGDKWSYLQRTKFGANTQPFYVAVDNGGKPLTPSYSYDEDIDRYAAFLDGGLAKYNR